MPGMIERNVAGEALQFHADRAVFWPSRNRLMIADLHLGKGDVMRAAGIAVPTGGTAHDLARLDVLLRVTCATELWVLGDFLHGRRSAAVERAWRALLVSHSTVVVSVVGGNHDRALVPDALDVALLPEDVRDGPFRFRHHPRPAGDETGGHVLCGHLHPVVKLPGLPGRYPAFVLDADETVLPAFSAFTGGMRIEDPAQRWIACAKGMLAGNA
ncbi:ligase-associated DNA damage response endonuclease PdeM [Lysobacter sp. A03]|uniref:ligase-associated DNA damage response endonuclease PdeM n=1 Tax=Lysobacter sp. A03 TaxID=1199154 RepID=UPI0005B71035|nr:ligase-associated DNA damage response endonuclease PdeM [Lysobacter sp. A03]KIQ97030.1 ICC-like protein phosphoesterase [Lysobacter sp. A03]